MLAVALLVGRERRGDVLRVLAADLGHVVHLREAGLVADDAVAADAHGHAGLDRGHGRLGRCGGGLGMRRHGSDSQDEKREKIDFALWKKASPAHIMRWPSPWGDGFPGWHIECSAMARSLLGDEIDIHGGGMDLKFPHHECEIAQGKGCNGVSPVKYWMHANMLTMNGARMSKSTGNYILPQELISGENDFFEKYKPGSKPAAFVEQEEIDLVKNLLVAQIKQTEEDLEKQLFNTYNERVTLTGFHLSSISDALEFNNFHEGMHLGMIMNLRKLV